MTIPLFTTSATIGLFRKSSMSHLLLADAYTLRAQSFPRQTAVERVVLSDLLKHILRAGVGPLLPQTAGQRVQNFPVSLRPRQRTQRATHGLDMMIDVCHAAIFF